MIIGISYRRGYLSYEELLLDAYDSGLKVKELYIPGFKGRIKGNRIAIAKDIRTLKEKTCVLAEELGHYYTSTGNIMNQNIDSNRKQEYRARLWAYDKQGFEGIIKAYEAGCQSLYEMADYLDVTEEFLNEAISCYKSKYGLHTNIDNYIIYFEPYLGVMKRI